MPHTPGPWIAQCPSFKGWTVYAKDGAFKKLAVVYSQDEDYGIDGGRFHDAECAANARLIAAAPALAKSLQRCAFLLQRIAEWDHQALENSHEAAEEARTALTEAGIETNSPD